MTEPTPAADLAAPYVPTLREYAEVIEFLAKHPLKPIPKSLERAYDDARHRMALHQFVKAVSQYDGPEVGPCPVCGWLMGTDECQSAPEHSDGRADD